MVELVVSMICYWTAIGVSLAAAYFFSRRKNCDAYEQVLWIVAICLPLALLAGLRENVGTDYENYIRLFKKVGALSVWECLTHSYLDILFITVLRFVMYLTTSPKDLFFFLSMVTLGIAMTMVVRRSKRIYVPLFVLLYYLIVFHPSLNVVRQGLAVSLFLWSVLLMTEKKYIPGAAVSLANVLIHNTALLGFVCLAVLLYVRWSVSEKPEGKYPVNWKLLVYYGAVLISPLLIPTLLKILVSLPVFSGYAKYVITDAKVGLGQIVYSAALFLPMLLFGKTIIKDDKLFGLFHVALLYIPVSYMGYYFNYASRMNMYTLMTIVLLVCMIVQKRKKDPKVWIFGLWYVLFFGYLYVSDILINNYHETLPYLW